MSAVGNVGYQAGVEDNVPANRSVLPPCKVCGAQATGIHYGASTCEACKVRHSYDSKYSRGNFNPSHC